MELPNIIIFTADEMRGDCISLSGKLNSVIKTPNIDELAKDGIAFTNCFTVNPVCVPSRIAVLTGQYPHSNGHRSLYQLLQPQEENLFKFLKEKGYEVIYIGRNDAFSKESFKISVTRRIPVNFPSKWKTNPFPKEHRLRKSFYYGQRTEEEAKDTDFNIIKKAINYLDSSPNSPFCLFLGLSYPHPPYTVEEPFFSMYDRYIVPTPILPNFNNKPKFMELVHKRYGLDNLTKEDFQEIVATYYGMISKVDHQFGQIMNKLKDINEYDNSAIFFFSDHGDFTGDYGLTEKWQTAFQDSLVRVPLIIKLPDNKEKNLIDDNLIENIDIFPTLLELAKIDTKFTHFGKNLLPLINGNVDFHREYVFSEGGYNLREPQCYEIVFKDSDAIGIGIYYDKTNIPKEDPTTVSRSVMIRNKDWKLILRDSGMEEFYDLNNDPQELENLIENERHRKTIGDLKEVLLRWYLNTSDNPDWRRERII
jgi:arylsulfatase A-like enzyme